MKEMYKIIRKPIISEKAAVQKDKQNKYHFYVSPDANKRCQEPFSRRLTMSIMVPDTFSWPGLFSVVPVDTDC